MSHCLGCVRYVNPIEPGQRSVLCPGLPAETTTSGAEHPHDAVRAFHEAFGVALGGSWTNLTRRALRHRLINEEFQEWLCAEAEDDPLQTLDALVDMVYVIVGAALEYGFDFKGAFDAVHAANMAKLGPDGKPIMRADGKVLKPEGWRAADLTPFLAAPLTCPERGHPRAYDKLDMAQTPGAPLGAATPMCACGLPCGPTRPRGEA